MKLFPEATSEDVSAAQCAAVVLDVVPAVMRTIRTQMRGHRAKLSIVQFRTIAYLSRNRGANLSDLAEHIGLTLPSASKLVHSMLLRGFLSRQVHSVDRRQSVLAPTVKGLKILEQARKATRQHLAQELSKIAPEQRCVIVAAMESLRDAFAIDERGCAQRMQGR